jgi:gliding motility-associated-like protein
MGQWQVVDNWGNAGSIISSPDYYHYLGTVASDIPETAMAVIDAFEGEAIMGLIACGKSHTETREYISTEFSAPMEVGKQYLVGFKIANGEKTTTSLSGLGVDKLGLFFSTAPVVQVGQDPILATPQFKIDSVFYSREWQSVNFLFTADQPYTNMTFGLFGTDNDKDIQIKEGTDPLYAYYFLDAFFMQMVPDNYDPNHQANSKGDHQVEPGNGHTGHVLLPSEEHPFYIPNTFTPNGDGNNEDFKPVASTIKDWEFEIFTKWGDKIFSTVDETRGWDGTMRGLPAENGSYVWQITYVLFNEKDEPRSIEVRGIVNLVR